MKRTPRTLSIVINDTCPLRCRHCSVGFGDSSRLQKADMTAKELRTIIRAIPTEKYEMVTFVGGEPTMSPQLLEIGIKECQSRGLMSSIATAPVWAYNLESAQRYLDSLPPFDFLILSFDRYHLEFLKIEHYESAVNAAFNRNIQIALNLCVSLPDEHTKMLNRIWSILDKVFAVNLQTIMPIGNATKEAINYISAKTIRHPNDIFELERSCVIGNVIVGLNGKINACCWSSAVPNSDLGFETHEEKDLKFVLDSMETDLKFKHLNKHGLIDGLGDQGKVIGKAVLGQMFVNECHLCMYLMGERKAELWEVCFDG